MNEIKLRVVPMNCFYDDFANQVKNYCHYLGVFDDEKKAYAFCREICSERKFIPEPKLGNFGEPAYIAHHSENGRLTWTREDPIGLFIYKYQPIDTEQCEEWLIYAFESSDAGIR